jgi:L-asparaginase II
MHNPVLVEVTRGEIVESRHRGMAVVVDGDGSVVMSLGEVETPVFPRSAVKSMQALPLVETGAADRYGFGNKELALACSSHSGEPGHMQLAGEMAGRAGLGEADFECGCHWSSEQKVLIDQARAGDKPNQLATIAPASTPAFSVCPAMPASITTAMSAMIISSRRPVRDVMADLTGSALGHDNCGIDGCSIPTYAAPLRNIAHGFARMASGVGLGPERAKAAERLMAACMAEPFYVAGTAAPAPN